MNPYRDPRVVKVDYAKGGPEQTRESPNPKFFQSNLFKLTTTIAKDGDGAYRKSTLIALGLVALGAFAGLVAVVVNAVNASAEDGVLETTGFSGNEGLPEQVQAAFFDNAPPSIGWPSGAAQRFTCPPPGQSAQVPAGNLVEFSVVGFGQLCTLVRINAQGKTSPIGRSYDGHEWEGMAAGLVPTTLFACQGNLCRAQVPMVIGERYALVSYAHSLDRSKQVARFLGQTTFGATTADIFSLASPSGGLQELFKQWFNYQISLPASSHREWYRLRSSPRYMASTRSVPERSACEDSSRWRRFAFIREDLGRLVQVVGTNPKVLRIDGFPITEVPGTSNWPSGQTLKVCSVVESVGGEIKAGNGCSLTLQNPAISFASSPPGLVSNTASLQPLVPDVPGYRILSTAPFSCNAPLSSQPAFARASSGELYVHEPRAFLEDNSMGPASQSRRAAAKSALGACPSAPMSFLNLDSCQVTKSSACVRTEYSHSFFDLNTAAVRSMYETTGRYVYVADVPAYESPCAHRRSRWIREASGACPGGSSNAAIPRGTANTLVRLLRESKDTHPYLRDVFLELEDICQSAESTIGAKLEVAMSSGATECWRHIHRDANSVYDFTHWATAGHPGNAEAASKAKVNPIQTRAKNGQTVLTFSHPDTSRWDDNRNGFDLLGRLDGQMDFAKLPAILQTAATAARFGAVQVEKTEYSMFCGSPGEVSNDPKRNSLFKFALERPDSSDQELDQPSRDVPEDSKSTTWTNIVLKSRDQLRQRMAWALSQILVVAGDDPITGVMNEPYTAYYDIFVRHAFGNFRDILKEVSFSPVMGDYLTFTGSFSRQFALDNNDDIFPDENYAREIMQLFSIGLYRLYTDGTYMMEPDGVTVTPSYGNDQITDFSRAWTGFDDEAPRGNLENIFGWRRKNKVDPMKIVAERRDAFPKPSLRYGRVGYIGDGYPLCVDLPSRAFLRNGAEYRFLGSRAEAKMHTEPKAWATGGVLRLRPRAGTSQLFDQLCNPSSQGCNYRPRVRLSSDIACDGQECDVDTIRLVHVSADPSPCPAGTAYEAHTGDPMHGDVCRTQTRKDFTCPAGCSKSGGAPFCLSASGTACHVDVDPGVFYEYIRPACVQHSFFQGGVAVSQHLQTKGFMCANPALPAAQAACCQAGQVAALGSCSYWGERVTFASAKQRCQRANTEACAFLQVAPSACDVDPRPTWFWRTESCSVLVKIDKFGKIALVHRSNGLDARNAVSEQSENWFKAAWVGNAFPTAGQLLSANCGRMDGEIPVCSVELVERPVFDRLPSVREIVQELMVGSFAPSWLSTGLKEIASGNGVRAYSRTGDFDSTTVFLINRFGKPQFLKNVVHEVRIQGSNFAFRNPPVFMSTHEQEPRDAFDETEAVLDGYFYHPNTAPFIAYRLIQRFTSSNPAPRYVDVVAQAFRSGKYAGYGSGKYGDLLATVAAVLQDREGRAVVVDADPAAGGLREPILKVLGLMRAMDFQSFDKQVETRFRDLDKLIGMKPHASPSVFSYFLPEFSPVGALSHAKLTAPEAQLLTTPYIVGFLNGITSLIKSGVTSCDNGFGDFCRNGEQYSGGRLTWSPASQAETSDKIIDELNTLLLAGRLSETSRQILATKFAAARNTMGLQEAVKLLIQLFAITPEFHTTNVHKSGETRNVIARPRPDWGRMLKAEEPSPSPEDGEPPRSAEAKAQPSAEQGPPASNRTASSERRRLQNGYKAVVFLFMRGAADTYNLLVPHSQCPGGDLYADYRQTRTGLALGQDDLLQIDVPAGTQPCSRFGVHPEMTAVRDMYNAGELAFIANQGVLIEPLTKDQYERRTRDIPPSLFSHSNQQQLTQTGLSNMDSPTGILGRMSDELKMQGMEPAAYSIDGSNYILQGGGEVNAPADVLDSATAVKPLAPGSLTPDVVATAEELAGKTSSSFYGDTWSAAFYDALSRTRILAEGLKNVQITRTFGGGGLGNQFQQVAKMTKVREAIGAQRDTFYVSVGGWDHHSNLESRLRNGFSSVNRALRDFKAEMIEQGVWQDTILVFASEFSRTLTQNSQVGSDHAWGGNYFVLGGGVKGGQILGKFPTAYRGNLNVGRGRLIPTTPWEASWNAISQWMGVEEGNIDKVLPNRKNFPNDMLFTQADLFN